MIKKLILMTLVIVGGVMTANATNYYVIGDPAGGWSNKPVANNLALAMTESSTMSGVYYYDYTPTGTNKIYFAIADGDGNDPDDNTWTDFNNNHRWKSKDYVLSSGSYNIVLTNGDGSMNFTPDGSSTYRIVFNSNTNKLNFVKKTDYVVAGCYGEDSNAAFFGTAWGNNVDANTMTMKDDGTLVLNFSNYALTTTNTIKYKVLEKNTWTGTVSNQTYVVNTAYTYNITFEVGCNSNDNIWNGFNSPTCTLVETDITSYYFVGGTGNPWLINATPLTVNEGIYNMEIEYPSGQTENYRFAFAPNTVIADNAVFNWNRLIRPNMGSDTDKELSFTNISNEDITIDNTQGNAWSMPASMSGCKLDFQYNSQTGKYTILPSFTRTIPANSYATFSSEYDVAIPNGVTAYYATGATVGRVTVTPIANGIPSTQAAMLYKENGGLVTFTPAETVEGSTTNLLVKGTTAGVPATTTDKFRYVFGTQNDVLAFYNVASNINQDMTGKAYLETDVNIKPASGAPILVTFGDDATDIRSIGNVVKEDNVFYDLSGRRVMNPTKGLYIVNGKKVIIK